MTITDIGDYLRANPSAWQQVPADMRAYLRAALVPQQGAFAPEQRAWISLWWLACDQAIVEQINAVLPLNVRVTGRALVQGGLALSCDLLSDCGGGETYAAAQAIIENLTLIYAPEFEPEAAS